LGQEPRNKPKSILSTHEEQSKARKGMENYNIRFEESDDGHELINDEDDKGSS